MTPFQKDGCIVWYPVKYAPYYGKAVMLTMGCVSRQGHRFLVDTLYAKDALTPGRFGFFPVDKLLVSMK